MPLVVEILVCLVVVCSNAPIVANAESSPGSGPFNEGDEVQYTCSQGYQLVGAPTIVCQNTGIFLPFPPSCVSGMMQIV